MLIMHLSFFLCLYVIRPEQTYIKVRHAYINKYAQWNWLFIEVYYLHKILVYIYIYIYIYGGICKSLYLRSQCEF